MPNTLHPTQIGYTPIGSAYQSTVTIGGNASPGTWEAIGFGQNGRPDYMERLVINLVSPSGVAPNQITRKGTCVLDVTQLIAIINGNSNAPSTGFAFALREVDVCENGTAKKMVVFASQTYLP